MQILMQAAQGQQNGTIQEFSISKSDINFFKVLDNKIIILEFPVVLFWT